MASLDLDDLPPRIAKALEALAPGEELVLTRGGVVVARLAAGDTAAPSELAAPPSETSQARMIRRRES